LRSPTFPDFEADAAAIVSESRLVGVGLKDGQPTVAPSNEHLMQAAAGPADGRAVPAGELVVVEGDEIPPLSLYRDREEVLCGRLVAARRGPGQNEPLQLVRKTLDVMGSARRLIGETSPGEGTFGRQKQDRYRQEHFAHRTHPALAGLALLAFAHFRKYATPIIAAMPAMLTVNWNQNASETRSIAK
jgi:hypothetical protein